MLTRLLAISLLVSNALANETSNYQKLKEIKSFSKFAFGSCSSPYNEQPLWEWIIKDSPQLWLWGGDNIYAETQDPLVIKQTYEMQNNINGYKKLKEKLPIIGTWDDHDYGYDNAQWDNPIKKESQKHFLDFINEPLDSKRREQQGVYTSYEFGSGETKVKFILLDNRYNLNDPLENGNILGEKQWRWFEKEITNSDAKIHFIVSGLSVMSYRIRITEEWIDHSNAFKRMRELLKKHRPSGTVFLSGDKHFSSIFKNFEHLEFMSSGLTHTAEGRLLRTYVSRFYPKTFFGLNYGLVEIHWDSSPVTVTLSIKSYYEKPVIQETYQLNQLNQWEKL